MYMHVCIDAYMMSMYSLYVINFMNISMCQSMYMFVCICMHAFMRKIVSLTITVLDKYG